MRTDELSKHNFLGINYEGDGPPGSSPAGDRYGVVNYGQRRAEALAISQLPVVGSWL